MLADLMQIENFFSTFREELEATIGNFPKDIRKSFLYIALVFFFIYLGLRGHRLNLLKHDFLPFKNLFE